MSMSKWVSKQMQAHASQLAMCRGPPASHHLAAGATSILTAVFGILDHSYSVDCRNG
ncbi:hypothetical protein EXN66_Car006458 [Channa argus]|uniref:Uncharacterized protein n=1 Tax=Channa argus TaxID=215402 RepID=A0A6G1PKW6_CHAAH|nr:hypothetical protein EXN66_Car006458 [Channa argus]